MLTAPTLAQIECVVHDRIRAVLAERVGEVGPLSGTEKLSATLGLSSLDLAFLVAELEAELGVDPFAKLVSITSVRSVEDLVRAYQQAFFPELQRGGRGRCDRGSGQAGADQASAEGAQMMGGNGSAGVAIVGIACRFPGAADHAAFWQNLCEGVESISALSDEDLLSAGVPAELLRDPSYVKAASLLPDIDQFDAAFFEYSPEEARLMDPQQRLLLEVAWEAFEDAGQPVGSSAQPIGVFTGLGGVVSSYLVDRLPFSADLPGYTGTLTHLGNDKDFPSTRISYKLNLTGPSINVQTACSTSLVAVHLACQAILAGECDMALAGAATVRVPQRVGYTSVKGGILSPDGHCRAFDADAQGTIFGSGVGAVLLKDLAAAVADGNHIYAVIRGSAINNDGADKVSYTASSAAGQARAMVEALHIADVSPDDIGYVECHGTGTVVGDPLEIDALTRAFRTGTERSGFCAIGSVKTNIGHLEQTAGLAALIKAALALKHGKIPPSLNFQQPQPEDRLRRESVLRQYAMPRLARGRSSPARRGQFARSRRHQRFRRARRTAGGDRDGG